MISGNAGGSGGAGGGGIYIQNTARVDLGNTIVAGNASATRGPDLYRFDDARATFHSATGNLIGDNSGNRVRFAFSGNAGSGGGIGNFAGTTTLTNSTVSQNTARNGGGIHNSDRFDTEGILNLTGATIAFNDASITGGIENVSNRPASLSNTIVARNSASVSDSAPDFSGTIASTGSFNLIESGIAVTGITNGTNGNQVGGTTQNTRINPKLDPTLAPNGGTTFNHALLPDSPAIDKGSAAGVDQRGLTRPSDSQSIANAAGGNGNDIGAFEVQFLAPTAAVLSVSGRAVTAHGRGIRNALITLTDSTGSTRTARTTALGRYLFREVNAGETYVVSAKGRRFTFSQPAQVFSVNEDTVNIDFTAN